MSRRLIVTTLLGAIACGAPPDPTEPDADRPMPSDPCGVRAGCTIDGLRPIDGLTGAHLARIVVKDADCERREHWLLSASRQTLLVADCSAQQGADSAGPAEIELSGSRLGVRYVEFGANDTCERVTATLDLGALTLEAHERQLGTVTQNECKAEAPAPTVPAPGDGSTGRPLLVLHRE